MDIGRSRPCNVDFMEEIDSVRGMALLFKLLKKNLLFVLSFIFLELSCICIINFCQNFS